MKLKLKLINSSLFGGYDLLSKSERLRLLGIVILSILLSAIEVIGVTAIMPFISVASNPSLINSNKYIHFLYKYGGFHNAREFAIYFGFGLIIFYMLRCVYSIFFQNISNKFSAHSEERIRIKLFAKYLKLPYKEYIDKNSSILQSNIGHFSVNFAIWINALLQLLSELMVSVTLYVLLLMVNFKMTIILTLILGVKIVLLSKFTLNKLKSNGHKIVGLIKNLANIRGAALGNFKMIKLRSNQERIMIEFANESREISFLGAKSQNLQQLPRVMLETVGFSMLIGVVIYILIRSKDLSVLIPIISMYAIALYRMLPSLNRIISNHNQIVYSSAVVNSIAGELALPEEFVGNDEIEFTSDIVMEHVFFKYNNSEMVLNDVNIHIKKGERVAFVGESGSGKSTLIDILIGLYKPLEGVIKVDNVILNDDNVKAWRRKFGYIPQAIYLFDGTVAQNVTFGAEYDEQKVITSLQKANIYDFLMTKDGIHTHVGEGGIQLSGGQKQRVGIARALYLEPEVLVLDEATSALDNDTEEEVMNEVYKVSHGKTLLVIAHRLSTVERCDRVIEIENGRVIK